MEGRYQPRRPEDVYCKPSAALIVTAEGEVEVFSKHELCRSNISNIPPFASNNHNILLFKNSLILSGFMTVEGQRSYLVMENPRSGLLSNPWKIVNMVGNDEQQFLIGYTYASSMIYLGAEASVQFDTEFLGKNRWSSRKVAKENKLVRTPLHACGCKMNQHIYIVMGGMKEDKVTPTVFEIDLRRETTRMLEPLKQSRAFHSCAPLNSTHIMVSGGKASADSHLGPILPNEVYHMSAETSREVSTTLVSPRYNHKLIVLEDTLFAIGGRLANNSDATMVEEYDPASETWSQTTRLFSNYTGSIAVAEFPQSSLDCVHGCDCGVSRPLRIIGGSPTQVPLSKIKHNN